MIEPKIESEDIPIVVCNMWANLAETISAGISDTYIADGPEAAIRFARCAEACYWRAMGESEAIDVPDINFERTPEAPQ